MGARFSKRRRLNHNKQKRRMDYIIPSTKEKILDDLNNLSLQLNELKDDIRKAKTEVPFSTENKGIVPYTS